MSDEQNGMLRDEQTPQLVLDAHRAHRQTPSNRLPAQPRRNLEISLSNRKVEKNLHRREGANCGTCGAKAPVNCTARETFETPARNIALANNDRQTTISEFAQLPHLGCHPFFQGTNSALDSLPSEMTPRESRIVDRRSLGLGLARGHPAGGGGTFSAFIPKSGSFTLFIQVCQQSRN